CEVSYIIALSAAHTTSTAQGAPVLNSCVKIRIKRCQTVIDGWLRSFDPSTSIIVGRTGITSMATQEKSLRGSIGPSGTLNADVRTSLTGQFLMAAAMQVRAAEEFESRPS